MEYNVTVDGLAMRETDSVLVDGGRDEETWYAYPHQVAARDLFEQTGRYADAHDSWIAMNQAPTGGGKTLSWFDPVIRQRNDAIVMYPTKTLIQDQFEAVEEFLQGRYNLEDEIGVEMFTSDKFDQIREENPDAPSDNGTILETRIRKLRDEYESVIIFTNPDVFSLLRHGRYDNFANARRVSDMFEVAVVDEFHYSDLKGQHSLVALLEQMRRDETSKMDKVMLLSATPNERLRRKLENMEAPFYNINQETDTCPLSDVPEQEDSSSWRPIMPDVELNLRSGQVFQNGDTLVSNGNIMETVDFCHQEARTVIMLDARREVQHVRGVLEQRLRDYDVMEIHGRTDQSQIDTILNSFNDPETNSILVTNAAAEVGIDFDTDQLIFSGQNPAKMMQRFGRLRNKEETCSAIAFVPLYTIEGFIDKTEELNMVTREKFKGIIQHTYPRPRRPDSFIPKFCSHEAYEQALACAETGTPELEEERINQALRAVREQFFEPYGIDFDRDAFLNQHEDFDMYIEELKQFRGGGPEVLVYDTEQSRVASQNLFSTLKSGNIDVVEEGQFFNIIDDYLEREARKLDKYTSGYIIYHGDEVQMKRGNQNEKPTPRTVGVIPDVSIKSMLSSDVRNRQPHRLNSFRVFVESNDLSPVDVAPLNECFEDEEPLAYVIEQERYEASYELNLDDFFFLTPVVGMMQDVSIAFSHNALYLYCIKQENAYRQRPDREYEIPIPETVHSR